MRKLLRVLFGDYSIYVIYKFTSGAASAEAAPRVHETTDFSEVSQQSIAASSDAALRERLWYFGEGSVAFGLRSDGEIVAACWYWFGDRYRQRNYWPLSQRQAKLVEIYTVEAYRGRGLARTLIRNSAVGMQAQGFPELFARVWHSNKPSIRAFAAAGWRAHRLVVDVRPFGQSMRFVLPPGLLP